MKASDGFYATIKEHIDNQWRQDYFKVCDLLLDAYLMGFNNGISRGNNPDINDTGAQETLEELVIEAGLNPKTVLRRLYCPQQTEENGECSCD